MKKLKNERGESILMALLLLLLASVISALILTAATNAAHHLRNDRKAQQNYLTVSSAAELIRDSILQESYTRVWEKVTTYTKDDAEIYVPKEEKTTLAPGKFTGIMKAWLAVGIEDNEKEGARYASVAGCQDTIKVDVPIKGEDKLQTVHGRGYRQYYGQAVAPSAGRTGEHRDGGQRGRGLPDDAQDHRKRGDE